ncbi:MAG: fimbria/pilus periplasmic chaperone [Acidimicrobiia bacterium]|nr:fimbria/pilus periplasmic chaperone [Acidimicrobiia bacterium]
MKGKFRMHRPCRTWKRWLAGLGISLFAFASQAAGLSVNPVGVTLEDPQQIRHLQLRNTGSEPMVLQASVKELSIADNREQYADTNALVVTPPVFTIEPGEEQVVRLGLQDPAPSTEERAFRVFLQQSPKNPATDDSDGNEPTLVQMNLRVGIPVFVRPSEPVARALIWQMEPTDDGHIRVVAENQGNTHSRISNLSLLDGKGEVLTESDRLTYLLPGSRRIWTLQIPTGIGQPQHLRFQNQCGSVGVALSPG